MVELDILENGVDMPGRESIFGCMESGRRLAKIRIDIMGVNCRSVIEMGTLDNGVVRLPAMMERGCMNFFEMRNEV